MPEHAEDRRVLPLASLGLEPWQCAFSARRLERVLASRVRRAGAGAGQCLERAAICGGTVAPPRSMLGAKPIRRCRYALRDGRARPRPDARWRGSGASCMSGTSRRWCARIAAHRIARGRYLLLFHDTHHRMASAPEAIGRMELDGFDGVLAFGEVLRDAYLRARLGPASVHLARSRGSSGLRAAAGGQRASATGCGSAIGATRSARAELQEFLIEPVRSAFGQGARRTLPAAGARRLAAAGIEFAGYLANFRVPRPLPPPP